MNKKKWLLLLVAAFSQTQIRIVGYIGISEVIMLFIGPIVLLKEWSNLKRDGLLKIIILAGLWLVSAVMTDWLRESTIQNALKGAAAPLVVLCITPCLYVLLRDDIRWLKWAIWGFVITQFLSVYVIQAGTSIGVAERLGVSAFEAAIDYKLTRLTLVMSVACLIPNLFYLRLPITSFLIMLALVFFSLIEGGRSIYLGLMISTGMLGFAGGQVNRMKSVSRSFFLIVILMGCVVLIAKKTYEYAALHGKMGEAELLKYEAQSSSKIGLLSGRSQFVSVILAVYDSPLLGHGSWALDKNGYGIRAAELLEDDFAINSFYRQPVLGMIPTHSHIFCAYVWHGVLGAIFWLYVLWVLYCTFRCYLGVEPELYAYLAISIPALSWAVLFSPFGGRVATITTLVVCLLLKKKYNSKTIDQANKYCDIFASFEDRSCYNRGHGKH